MPHDVSTFSFNAGDYPEPVRFSLWREVMAATHEVTLPNDDAPPFTANVTIWRLGHLLLSHGDFASQVFTRTPGAIRRDHIDHYGLFIQAEGTRRCRTNETELVLGPGDALVFDLAQPMTSLTTDGSSGTLYLQRDLVDAVIPGFSRLHGTVLRDAAASLLARHIYTMGEVLPQVSPDTMIHLANATREMALACLLDHAEGNPEIPEPLAGLARRMVENYIDANLGDLELGVASICAALAISRTSLYRLFEPDAGIAGYIKERRLRRIRGILVAGVDDRALAEIAADFGFKTGAHFSREFRAAFGHPPGELRAGHDKPVVVDRIGIDRIFQSLGA